MNRLLQVAALIAAVAACGKSKDNRGKPGPIAKAKLVEAQLQLAQLERIVRETFATVAELPKGRAGPTPAAPCCAQPDKQCPLDANDWTDPVWRSLSFQVAGPTIFQYSYESDGRTFTATATGDPLCNGKPSTITLAGTVEGSQLRTATTEQ